MTEVRFCNLCDRSVPEGEIQEGAALLVEGRVLCPECRPLLARAVGRRRGGGGPAVLLAFLALAGVGALGWEGWRLAGELDGRAETLAASLDRTGREEAVARGELARSLADTRSLLADRLDAREAEQATALQEMAARLDRMEESLGALERLAGELASIQEKLGLLEGETAVAGDRQRALRATLERIRDRVEVLESRAALAAAAGAREATEGAAESFPPEVTRLLRSLQAEDPRERYDALEKLASRQDLRLLPHIYPLLADPYEFVRFLAAHTLGEWEARPAVPHLIEALLDEKPFVAEAAVGALRRLTGQDFGFDPGASQEARRRVHDAWLAWWREHGEEFLAARP